VKLIRIVTIAAVIAAAAVVIVAAGRHDRAAGAKVPAATAPRPVSLPSMPESYIGVYAARVPNSYADVTAFTSATGVRPNLVAFYSGWQERFPANFAATAARDGAVPLVQIEPTSVSLADIASGRYDGYVSSYAQAVRAYHQPVILSFGHEMNGSWYSWGYRHASPATFVAAWRHIVTVFRAVGADNVTWMWTVNVISDSHTRGSRIPSPAWWWPGSSYVTWVGIDGYYYRPSWRFVSLFGPTIAAVRALTSAPILIAETGAPGAVQPAKIADLFGGVRSYGLLGLVWFNAIGARDWRLASPAAIAEFGRGAKAYRSPGR
jgi:mannan endo-1,4-beta-mannosidase